jgi:hypothetical protein
MKGLTLLLSLIALASAGVAGMLYMRIGNERAGLQEELGVAQKQLATNQQRVADLTQEKEALTGQVKALQDELNEIKARNTTLEARSGQLSREITQAREAASTQSEADAAATRTIAELNRQLLEARAAATAASAGATAEQVAAYESRIADLEAQVASLRGTTGERPDPLAHVPPGLTANVIDVDRYGAIVVLDVGTKNGAAESLEMVLRRGSVVVARVRLTDVRETYSIAQVLPRTGNGNIRPGDVATRS